MSKSHEVIPYNKVDVKQLSNTEPQDNERVTSQKLAYFRYGPNGNQLHFQSPKMKMDNYGIPDENSKYNRNFMKIAGEINEEVEGETDEEKNKRKEQLNAFINIIKGIDETYGSAEKKKELFGKNAKNYEYIPMYKLPPQKLDDSDSDDDENEKEEEKVRPGYIKAKIQVDWNDQETVQCEVYRKNKEDTDEFKEDGKYSKMEVTTIDDVKNYVRYMSDYRCVLSLSKLWASKQPMNGQTKKNYGITLKLIRVETQQRNIVKPVDTENNPFFIDDSDDENNEVEKVLEKKSHFDEDDDDDDDDDDDEDSDDDDNKAKANSKKRGTKKNI